MAADSGWTAVVRNLQKARREWDRLTRVMGRDGVDAWTSGQIYLAVVHSVMLYWSEIWFMTPHIGKVLRGFHHRVARRLTGIKPWQGRDGVWT